jgi:hypothetical protein
MSNGKYNINDNEDKADYEDDLVDNPKDTKKYKKNKSDMDK